MAATLFSPIYLLILGCKILNIILIKTKNINKPEDTKEVSSTSPKKKVKKVKKVKKSSHHRDDSN